MYDMPRKPYANHLGAAFPSAVAFWRELQKGLKSLSLLTNPFKPQTLNPIGLGLMV